jgi:hypothetical protein
MNIIEITQKYAEREQITEWLKSYCKRNRILIETVYREDTGWRRDIEPEYRLTFKSSNQADYFVRIGNQNFPYFEFI